LAEACLEALCQEPVGCTTRPRLNGLPCEDGLFCTAGDVCLGGICLGQVRDCADADPCTTDGCSEDLAICEHLLTPSGDEGPPGGTFCEDDVDNDCDGLTDGQDADCVSCGTVCDDGNPCTYDVCIQGDQCAYPAKPAGDSCDDGLFCTRTETCDGQGACLPAGQACESANACKICDEVQDRCVDNPSANPVAENTHNGNCTDSVDNDCDDLTDSLDPGCR
jgi:hypothetical protein